ncbi:MAG: NADH-quinone oxidoreductase subunit N [Verrucomicrobia bacterium]|nr:NADH-quinone oxidoreductase subunit N [Verrucomicrobiota bacterium]
MSVDYFALLKLVAPETMLVLAAFAVLAIDLGIMRREPLRHRMLVASGFAFLGFFAAVMFLASSDANMRVADGMFIVEPLGRIVKIALIALAAFTLALSLDSDFTDHAGEFVALVLLATVGMMFMASTENLLMIFVSLELVSLSLYVLAAFNKRNPRSAEAALKYFLFGGMAAAFALFGLSLLYGMTGSIYLPKIAAALKGHAMHPLLAVALVLTVIGFGFKIAAVPFHLWAPDAYQGAPTPSAAFIASGSKVASFFLFAKVMMTGFDGAEGSAGWHQFAPGWMPLLATLAVLSMLLGNLAAIAQTSVKRLLAWSAIAHAGYALLAILCNNAQGVTSLLYYIITYGLTVVGALGVAGVLERGGDATLADFAGLRRRAPVLAVCMMVFMLSLAGIPPLAGFFGKFYVFVAVTNSAKNLGLLWLVIVGIAMSAVSLYYYLIVLKHALVMEAPAGAGEIHVPLSARIALVVLALGVIVLGCAPDLLVEPMRNALVTVAQH